MSAFSTPLLTYIMYSFMSFVLYVFKSIFSSNIYCIINIYNPSASLLGGGGGGNRDCVSNNGYFSEYFEQIMKIYFQSVFQNTY